MKRTLGLGIFVASLLALHDVVFTSAVLAQGPLAPTGPPEPTMKSLDQIEPRTALAAGANASHSITNPGSYYLTGDVRSVYIDASDVVLDLNGFSVACGTNSPDFYAAITVMGNTRRGNIVIKNGAVVGPVVPTYAGPDPWNYTYSYGSSWGIYMSSRWENQDANFPQNVRIEDLVVKNFGYGIYVASFNEFDGGRIHVIRCTVRDSAYVAMWFDHAIVRDCVIQRAGDDGLRVSLSSVENVVVERCGADGIEGDASTIRGSVVRYVGGRGVAGNNSILENVAVSGAGDGINSTYGVLTKVVCVNNRFSGIAGGGLAIDGAVVHANGAHGIVASGSTVRGVRASDNNGAGVYCDDSSINECMVYNNAHDGIRGVNSTINACRSFNNDTNKSDGYTASDIYWFGGSQQANVAGTYAPAP
jgi:hypothetical protein